MKQLKVNVGDLLLFTDNTPSPDFRGKFCVVIKVNDNTIDVFDFCTNHMDWLERNCNYVRRIVKTK